MMFALFLGGLFFIACLYSSVGHAGASGYLAWMALLGFAPEEMRPTALVLNVFVATIATLRFSRVRPRWQFLLYLLVGSAPLAFIGGFVPVPRHVYRPLVAIVLLAAAVRMLVGKPSETGTTRPSPSPFLLFLTGAVLGLLAGLTGTGGGIFLTPVLILTQWTSAREAAAITAPFVLINSISGLLGVMAGLQSVPTQLLPTVGTVALGGFLGSTLGSTWFSDVWLRRALSVVLVIAALKLLFVP
ncbi:MAG: sulfite exporter TauE/SafE family protein [Thermogutta sp.]|uniref:sulfite exporter TauE/SafE family protein n=1 Tax=Thermogutta sp. TaxID=1962930 RepID=UPI001992B303|nr:sulfite exporter TauE/SafE family protein [Thermogutta sp.]MBC7353737.1 sulfite exporter TauE/SafE family protein [Thermogutta sp.]